MQVSSCDLLMQVCGKQFIHIPYDGSGQNVCQLSKYIHEMTFDATKGLIFINVMLLELQLLDVSSEISDQEQRGTHCNYYVIITRYEMSLYNNNLHIWYTVALYILWKDIWIIFNLTLELDS